MASRAVVPRQPQRAAENKPKPADGRKGRRALGDIGNVLSTRDVAITGKPVSQTSRPITRSFGAQLLANAAAAAAAHKKTMAALEAGVVGKATQKAAVPAPVPVPAPARKSTKEILPVKPKSRKDERAVAVISLNQVIAEQKPDQAMAKLKLENQVVIVENSSDSDEEMKSASNLSISYSAKISSKQTRKTLTSVLTARSKMACGLSNRIASIDAKDEGDQLAVVEYVEDIYTFYRLAETSNRIHDYMHSQLEINSRMRSILADWLIEVHNKFELMPETIYLTMYIVDKYLSLKTVPRRELQLLGIAAMLIACKYEEIWAPEVNDFECISDRAYTGAQILIMEKMVLNKLEWRLTVPTTYVFLVRFIKAAQSDKELEHMTFFFSELALVNYSMIMFGPSVIAASCVYAAQGTLRKVPLWSETLRRHTAFSEAQLKDCVKMLVQLHSMAASDKLRAVYKKYSSPERSAVALLPPASKLMGTASEEVVSCSSS